MEVNTGACVGHITNSKQQEVLRQAFRGSVEEKAILSVTYLWNEEAGRSVSPNAHPTSTLKVGFFP